MDEQYIEKNGIRYRVTSFEVDQGPKNGVTKVIVYDPCITEESQQKRRAAILAKCQELAGRSG